MKKVIIVLITIVIILTLSTKEKELIIPKEAIRFRVIANSDTNIDQETKTLVRDKIQNQMINDLSNTDNIKDARNTLTSNIPNYENLIKDTLVSNQKDNSYEVNYGLNYFPEKNYKGVKYEEGYYESLVVTLGNGNGNNWWCVLFPPLCLLEAEETEETTEVEYKFFISELIDKYF